MGKLTMNVAIQLEAAQYIYARIEGNPVQALRHQTDGQVMPSIFPHPGRERTASATQQDSDGADNTESPEMESGTVATVPSISTDVPAWPTAERHGEPC